MLGKHSAGGKCVPMLIVLFEREVFSNLGGDPEKILEVVGAAQEAFARCLIERKTKESQKENECVNGNN